MRNVTKLLTVTELAVIASAVEIDLSEVKQAVENLNYDSSDESKIRIEMLKRRIKIEKSILEKIKNDR